MAENLKLDINEYNESIKDIKEAAECLVPGKPTKTVSGNVPSWSNYIKGFDELLNVLDLYYQVVLVSAQDFQKSGDLLVEADRIIAENTRKDVTHGFLPTRD